MLQQILAELRFLPFCFFLNFKSRRQTKTENLIRAANYHQQTIKMKLKRQILKTTQTLRTNVSRAQAFRNTCLFTFFRKLTKRRSGNVSNPRRELFSFLLFRLCSLFAPRHALFKKHTSLHAGNDAPVPRSTVNLSSAQLAHEAIKLHQKLKCPMQAKTHSLCSQIRKPRNRRRR